MHIHVFCVCAGYMCICFDLLAAQYSSRTVDVAACGTWATEQRARKKKKAKKMINGGLNSFRSNSSSVHRFYLCKGDEMEIFLSSSPSHFTSPFFFFFYFSTGCKIYYN